MLNNFVYIFSCLGLMCSLMLIVTKNPVHSVFFLILVFCFSSVILLFLTVDFLAIIFIVVYVGAIAVLFLFVVMMLNIKLSQLSEGYLRYLPVGLCIILIFSVDIFFFQSNIAFYNYLGSQEELWLGLLQGSTNISLIGELLYTHLFINFVVSSLILLIAMVGTICLTLHHSNIVRRQFVYEQIGKNFNNSIVLKSFVQK